MTTGGAGESSASNSSGGDELGKIVDSLVDLFIYAPLGFALDAKKLLPELTSRGRDQVNLLRVLSKFAVPVVKQKGESFLKDPISTIVGATKPQGSTSTKASTKPTATPTHSAPSASDTPEQSVAESEPASVPKSVSKARSKSTTAAPAPRGSKARPSTKASPAGKSPAKKATSGRQGASVAKAVPVADVLVVPIEGYDALPASAIVEMIDRLTPQEQNAVEAYERANRGRRTVLGKLSQRSNES